MNISDKSNTDIIAAVSSVPGPAYRAIIRVSGRDLLRRIIHNSTNLQINKRGCYSAVFYADGMNLPVSVLWMPAPNSFTGEDVAEIHFSGGETVQMMLLRSLFGKGARLARPGEFTERAFLNGRIDLTRAEAVMTAINAQSREEIQAAAMQLSGHFEKNLAGLRTGILNLLAQVELTLDFADQEIPNVDIGTIRRGLEKLSAELDKMICGCMATEGKSRVLVSIFGAPGIGKSSLFNRIAGKPISIVHPEPGTTRDVLEIDWTHEGLCFRLADTPSLCQENEEISGAVRRAVKDIAARSDFIVLIESGERELTDTFSMLGIGNDDSRIVRITRVEAGRISAGEFAKLLQSRLGNTHCGAKFAVNMRQRALLDRVSGALKSASLIALDSGGEELIAEELRSAASGISELTGGDVSTEVLSEIFSSFCLGK